MPSFSSIFFFKTEDTVQNMYLILAQRVFTETLVSNIKVIKYHVISKSS